MRPVAQVIAELESKAPRDPAAEASPAAPASDAAAAAPADDPMESEDGPAAEAAPLLPLGTARPPILPTLFSSKPVYRHMRPFYCLKTHMMSL